MAKTTRIQVGSGANVSLDELVRDLRKVDRDLPKRIQKANKAVATKVAETAKDRLRAVSGAASSSIRAQAADKIRPRARQKSASVALLASRSTRKVDAFPFEFGTRFHKVGGRTVRADTMRRRVFPAWVGNKFQGGDWKDGVHGKEGHVIHPAVDQGVNSGRFSEMYAEEIDKAMRGLYD